MSEEPLPEEEAHSPLEDDEPEETSLIEEEPVEEEKPDPFSLKQVERTRVVAATVPKAEYDLLLGEMKIIKRRAAEDREKLREADRFKDEADESAKFKEKSKSVFLLPSLYHYLHSLNLECRHS